MTRLLRGTLLSLGALALLTVGAGVALAASVAASGFAVVEVHERGHGGVHFKAPVPVALLSASLGVAQIVAREEFLDARRQLEPYAPMIQDLLQELERAGSFTLVSVRNADETVLITKEEDNLVVDLDLQDTTVHISFPLNLVHRVLDPITR